MTETPNPYLVDADTLTGELRPIRPCVLSIGSNQGDRIANLQGAVDSLVDTPGVWVTEVSPVYETDPVDAPDGSASFLNAVVLLDSSLPAQILLERAMAIEAAFGRTRSGLRNAPRTLDVDLIMVGDRRSDTEALTLPHPRAHERAFVLAPWADADPEAEVPGRGAVLDLLHRTGRVGVVRRDDAHLVVH